MQDNHAAGMKKQYLQIQNLKQNLKKGSCNSPKGLCQTMNEIQSGYWNQTMVILHPIVIYYADNNGNIAHKSYIYI